MTYLHDISTLLLVTRCPVTSMLTRIDEVYTNRELVLTTSSTSRGCKPIMYVSVSQAQERPCRLVVKS